MVKLAREIIELPAVYEHSKLPRKIAYILWGAPVCGKDTFTDELIRLFSVPVLRMGPAMQRRAEMNPHGHEAKAIAKGNLVQNGTAIWFAKQWILKHVGSKLIMLNGMPRNVDQMVIIDWLREHGFEVRVIRFTTPMSVCARRPLRPDRPHDTWADRVRRMKVYKNETLPMRTKFGRYGISEAAHNLLCIDNSKLKKEETATVIINHFNLPFDAKLMFRPDSRASAAADMSPAPMRQYLQAPTN